MNVRTIRGVFQEASSFLRKNNIDDANFDAEVIIRRVLKTNRAYFFTHMDDHINEEDLRIIKGFLQRRANNEPLQYILGDQEFFGRNFVVNNNVLIPRPETEILIEKILYHTEQYKDDPLHVVDIGTGSGAIAITLASERPNWFITAIDISSDALAVASLNARKIGVKVNFVQNNYLEKFVGDIDILVSNPPYIPSNELPFLQKEVVNFEPNIALDGGCKGLNPYISILDKVKLMGSRPKIIGFEIGINQEKEVIALMKDLPDKYTVLAYKDLKGLERVVLGIKEDF